MYFLTFLRQVLKYRKVCVAEVVKWFAEEVPL